MDLRVVGAGLPRTGTTSLKAALERLTGVGCYHMLEVFSHADTHIALWQRAVAGDAAVLDEILSGFGAAVDWPSSSFWEQLAAANPDAVIVLSSRRDAAAWWDSVDRTVWEAMRRGSGMPEWDAMVTGLCARLGVDDLDDRDAAISAYEAHNARVRAAVATDRLIDWQATDGWGPLCRGLGVAEPDEAFPRLNDTGEFRTMAGWD